MKKNPGKNLSDPHYEPVKPVQVDKALHTRQYITAEPKPTEFPETTMAREDRLDEAQERAERRGERKDEAEARKAFKPFQRRNEVAKKAMLKPKRHYLESISSTVETLDPEMRDILSGESLSLDRSAPVLCLDVYDIDSQSYARYLRSLAWGVTDWIAAAMLGVPPGLLNKWLRKGERATLHKRQRTDPLYRPFIVFYMDTLRASAVARMSAEIKVALTEPLQWLKSSPVGKSRPNRPGWTPDANTADLVAVDAEAAKAFRDREVSPQDKARLMAQAIRELEKQGYIQTTEEGQTFFKLLEGQGGVSESNGSHNASQGHASPGASDEVLPSVDEAPA